MSGFGRSLFSFATSSDRAPLDPANAVPPVESEAPPAPIKTVPVPSQPLAGIPVSHPPPAADGPSCAPVMDDSLGALKVTHTVEQWRAPECLEKNGLLVRRKGVDFNALQSDVDKAMSRFGGHQSDHTLEAKVANGGTSEELGERLDRGILGLLGKAQLPDVISRQLRADACRVGAVVGTLCPDIANISLKLNVIGANSCKRWHQDNYACRAIISYTGDTGTEYTPDENVDFHELMYCGNNDCIIKDKSKTAAVLVGDIMLIKGSQYPQGASGIVHKSPEKVFDAQGGVLNRLVLKIDMH